MTPDVSGARRRCEACDKQVHDLSAMDERSARAFWAAASHAKLCVRYLSNARGEIVFGLGPQASRDFVSVTRLRAPSVTSPVPARAAVGVSLAAVLVACSPASEAPEPLELDVPTVAMERPVAPPASFVIPMTPCSPEPPDPEPVEVDAPKAKVRARAKAKTRSKSREGEEKRKPLEGFDQHMGAPLEFD